MSDTIKASKCTRHKYWNDECSACFDYQFDRAPSMGFFVVVMGCLFSLMMIGLVILEARLP